MSKQKKQLCLTLAILLLLAAATAVLLVLNRPSTAPEAGYVLRITADGSTLCSFTMEQLRALPAAETEKEIRSSGSQTVCGHFQGVSLHTLFDAAGVDLSAVGQVIARASDGYVTAYTAAEAAAEDAILLAYAMDGSPLPDDSQSGGPLRLLVLADDFGTRSAKMVVELELKS